MHEKIFKRRVQNMVSKEQEMLEEHGWLVHFVFESNGELNGLANCHTHGLLENFGHKDLQIVLPISPENAHPLLSGIVSQIKEGRVFEPDIATSKVISNFDVFFKEFEENERTVLRLILPDPNGKYPSDEDCEDPYNRQFEILNTIIV